ncbi:MAG: hypothetical protein LBM20_04045 [Rikenellaceae bacterium]|jgi:hypothetical protein|nr:hypothetical protein [Rikenellaceae bacterium]
MKNGYTHHFGKTTGGIKTIALTPVENINSVAIDHQTGAYLSVTLKELTQWVECSLAEEAAEYREEHTLRNGIAVVVHTLEFQTDKMDRESDSLLRQLAEASPGGLAAVVTTNDNVSLLVGYSPEHGAERPLRLEKVAGRSGKKYADPSREAISLVSRDTAKARILNGSIG